MDHRLWTNRKRLNYALSGIFEVRQLPDLILAGFSKWTEGLKTYWAYVLFNQNNQLLSIQIMPESDLGELIMLGVPVWTDADEADDSPGAKLLEESVDLLAGPAD